MARAVPRDKSVLHASVTYDSGLNFFLNALHIALSGLSEHSLITILQPCSTPVRTEALSDSAQPTICSFMPTDTQFEKSEFESDSEQPDIAQKQWCRRVTDVSFSSSFYEFVG